MSRKFCGRMPALALGVLGCGALVTVAYASHSWGNYHWARPGNPFGLQLGDNVSAAWDVYLTVASADWSQSVVLNTFITAGRANPKNCRPASGRIEICSAAYGNNGWLGIAQIWASGSHITQATVKVNDTYYSRAQYNTPAWRQFVMCQEIGHAFGLDHQDENFNNANLGSCMDYTNNPDSNQHPNNHDYAQLETIYGHLDTTTTVGSSTASAAHPPAMNSMDLDGPGQWGRLVSSSRNGRSETYELDFGGGHKVLTHVTWADGPGRRGQQ